MNVGEARRATLLGRAWKLPAPAPAPCRVHPFRLVFPECSRYNKLLIVSEVLSVSEQF